MSNTLHADLQEGADAFQRCDPNPKDCDAGNVNTARSV